MLQKVGKNSRILKNCCKHRATVKRKLRMPKKHEKVQNNRKGAEKIPKKLYFLRKMLETGSQRKEFKITLRNS